MTRDLGNDNVSYFNCTCSCIHKICCMYLQSKNRNINKTKLPNETDVTAVKTMFFMPLNMVKLYFLWGFTQNLLWIHVQGPYHSILACFLWPLPSSIYHACFYPIHQTLCSNASDTDICSLHICKSKFHFDRMDEHTNVKRSPAQ